MIYHYPRDFPFPWQPYFDRHVFQKLSCSICKLIYVISQTFYSFQLVLSELLLDGFLILWKNSEIQDG